MEKLNARVLARSQDAGESSCPCGGASYRATERGGPLQQAQKDRKPEESGRSASGQVEGVWCRGYCHELCRCLCATYLHARV